MAATQEVMSDWFKKTAELTEAALQATARVQQEALDRWMETLVGMHPAAAQSTEAASELLPAAQRSAREYMEALDEAYRNGMDVLRECFEGRKSSSPKGLQDCIMKAWKQSMHAVQQSSQKFMQANSRMLEAWSRMLGSRTSE